MTAARTTPTFGKLDRRSGRVGWAADQLHRQGSSGFWEAHEPRNLREWFDFLYFPAFLSTNWRALILADCGTVPAAVLALVLDEPVVELTHASVGLEMLDLPDAQ